MATVGGADLRAVQSLAKRASKLHPRTANEIALVAFMAGALYSLTRAIRCRFDDARMTPDIAALPAELTVVLEREGASQQPQREWLAGYDIDSAMMRSAALGERLSEHAGLPKPLDPAVPNAVSSLKHDLDAGIEVG